VAYGGRHPTLHSACFWAGFLFELASEREAACILGHQCSLLRYLAVVSCGIISFMPPWVLLESACDWLVLWLFGEDPIVEQKAVLEQVAVELAQSQRGHEALVSARQRAGDFFGRVELASLWRRVKITRDACQLLRSASFRDQAPMQQTLASLVHHVALIHLPSLQERLAPEGRFSQERATEVLEGSMAPIVLRRHADLVRSALTQVAERSLEDLLLGVTATLVPGLQDSAVVGMLGLRAEFAGEDGVDAGGVRRDFVDSFADALARPEAPSGLALVEPLRLLGLGADSTWRPVPCDDASRGFLWALGRLLALALVYRCPCPVPLSLLVFKCILGTHLRPGDVRQLDPDFWRHRVQPLLPSGGATRRQEELRAWGMDPLTFTSADGSRELCSEGAKKLVTEANKEEYAQLLCEDFLIGQVRSEMGCLVTGFHEVIPQELMKDLDAEQLRMLVCGVAELDVDEWEAHAQVEGSRKVACWFFDWLRKRPQEARTKMLAFTTGSSVLPCGWDGLKDPLGRKLPFRVSAKGDAEALPTAHTCANLLVLPQVAKRQQLERKLDQVVELAGREMLIL